MRNLNMAILCAALVGFTGTANAQDNPQDRYIASLKQCQGIAAESERLKCFDQAVGSIVSASDSQDLQIVDREQVRQTRRKLFGFSLPDLGIFGRKDNGDEAAEQDDFASLETTIAGVSAIRGGYLLTTAEGAKWQIDNVPRRLMTPRVGQSLEIRSAALSAYFLRINGQGGVKGKRVQ